MKKVLYIGIAVVALGLASCSKQDIQPNSAEPEVPVWKANTGGCENVDPNTNGSNEGGITDPEHNEEQSSNTDGI